MLRWLKTLKLMVVKEVSLELRGKELATLLICTTLVVAALIGAGVSSAVLDAATTTKIYPMLVWIVFLITTTTASARASEAELEGRGFEGLLLAVCLVWIPTAIRPVAAMRAAAEQDERIYDAMAAGTYKYGDPVPPAESKSLADWLLARANDVDNSAVGSTVNAANPMSSSQILDVAEDYLAVLRDEDATNALQASDVWKEMLAMPSVAQARGVVEADPSLQQVFEQEGFNISALRALLDSPTVLKVMDETDIRAELEPLAPRLIASIKQARENIKPIQPFDGGAR
jgi:hypothetical protein